MITAAALRFKTTDGSEHIMPLHRHGDGFAIIAEFKIPYVKESVEQGFINSTYKNGKWSYEFVNRIEAKKIAHACLQLKNLNDTYGELYSEDLW